MQNIQCKCASKVTNNNNKVKCRFSGAINVEHMLVNNRMRNVGMRSIVGRGNRITIGPKESAIWGASLCGAQGKEKGESQAADGEPRTAAVTLTHQQQKQAMEAGATEGKGDLSTIKKQQRQVDPATCLGSRVTKARSQDAGKTQRTETKGSKRNEKELTLDNRTA